jgi:predicted ATPase/DNA-binding XRE family transcriptional regulator
MDTFGEWLRQQRIQLKLTHQELADRVGCSVVTIRKIEYGERRPSAQIAGLIANCLDIPLAHRPTFVKVARGELSVDRLAPVTEPVATSKISRINLPVFPTPLIGRQREVEELGQLLRDPQCRLLTLVGPGGIGKTRLAVEAASQLQDREDFADGVYFIPLASTSSTRFILPVIADSVGFAFHHASHADPKTQLFGYLKEKQVLLLTDNLEHLLAEPGIEVLAELLTDALQVKLVATSREALGLQDEWVYEVHGLPVPEHINADGNAQNTSVELFLQRARRANVGYSFTVQDYPSILRICQLVEGMPLGIELAAGWVRILSCNEIAREIERGLDFLTVSARDIPARHRSMRLVFDHSWRLLTEEEQRVLLRLSVFRGGFRREAAEAVAGATLSMLSTLVTKSLIRRSGAGRFDLHQLIRQFAAEHLAERPEEQRATQAYHGRFYLNYFSQAEGRLCSSAQLEALAELSAEMDNFRAAWDWSVIHGDYSLIEQTMRMFWILYDARGWFQEGLDMLGHAVDALEMVHGHSPSDRTDQVALGHFLINRAWFAYRLANYEQSQAMLERSLEILRPLNEPRVLVESITYLGELMEVTGNYARALQLYSEGLEVATAIGDQWIRGVCLILANGPAAFIHGKVKPEHAYLGLQGAVAEWRHIGDPRLTAFGLRILSQSAFTLGRYDEARLAMEESVALNSSVGDRWGLGSAYRGLGMVAQAQGRHQQALVIFRESLDIFTELGGSWWVARVLAEMSWSIFALGNDAEAEHIWRESLRIASDIRGTPVALEALAGFASLQVKRGDLENALELLLLVLNHPAGFPETRNRLANLRADLEPQMTSQQVEMALRQAQAKTLETAVDEILM